MLHDNHQLSIDPRDARVNKEAKAKILRQAFTKTHFDAHGSATRDVPGEREARIQEFHGSTARRRRARALVGVDVMRQPLGHGGHPKCVDDGRGEPVRGGLLQLLRRRRRGRELLSDLTGRRSDHHSNFFERIREGNRVSQNRWLSVRFWG